MLADALMERPFVFSPWMALLLTCFLSACSESSSTNRSDASSRDPDDGAKHQSCEDQADGVSCEGGGSCLRSRCVPSTCGNNELDPGEECDDGNLVSGDGCELDCTFSCHEDADCLDDDPCTLGERCVEAGAGKRCQAGTMIQCPPEDANPCLMYTCDPEAAELGYCRSSALIGCFPDEDRDGFPLFDESKRVAPVGANCSCPEIDGVRYIHPRSDDRWDCDDTNERHYPGAAACFMDADGDGYPAINEIDTMREDCSCFEPYIHRRSDVRWDCDDASARHHPDAPCFFDRDGDGYPSSDEAAPMGTTCICPDEDATLAREDGVFDCDDENPHIHPSAPCYPDADGDGYHLQNATGSMSSSCECPSATIPFAPERDVDCDDSNEDVFPRQSNFFETGYCPGLGKSASCSNSERSFDYNCDADEEKIEYCTRYCCEGYSFGCVGLPYWSGGVPACGEMGTTQYCDIDCGLVTTPTRVSCR